MTAALLIDLLVAGLLIATTFACVNISRKLSALRAGEGALRELVGELSATTQRAETALRNLKQSAEHAGAQLSGEAARARALTGELSLIIETADALANRLAQRRANDAGEAPRPAAPPSMPNPIAAALRGAR
ncbi:MAG TPA: DUF6468 domain-containing protein [Micropepsaceae bacterium]|nr:DUF6468 domain-containing protein [Micropepsaceae bacterium]